MQPDNKQQKIIHIDMDSFYASVEMRDDPRLKHKPIAVGGTETQRGVLCTSNYIARQFGVHSAMSTAHALQLCPELIIIPPHIEKYKKISQTIREIFYEYTDGVEPLSLDEAYLDVSSCQKYSGSATWIADNIRKQIYQAEGLTASAGVSTNKFLAKVASDWNKPNGQLVIPPCKIAPFVKKLPVNCIAGVGPVTAKKLNDIGLITCKDLQRLPIEYLYKSFGEFGKRLYDFSRGIDTRTVKTEYIRKSLSVEETYPIDIEGVDACIDQLNPLLKKLLFRFAKCSDLTVRSIFIKIKFNDFATTTVETINDHPDLESYIDLLKTGYLRYSKPVRLLGMGVRFHKQDNSYKQQQLELL